MQAELIGGYSGKSRYYTLYESGKTYTELHEKYAATHCPLEQIAVYDKQDGTSFKRTRIDPGKNITADKGVKQQNFYPLRWTYPGDYPSILVEGEKAAVALASNPKLNQEYCIYSVGSLAGFKNSILDEFHDRTVIFWPDTDEDGSVQGLDVLKKNLNSSGVVLHELRLIKGPKPNTDAADYTPEAQCHLMSAATVIPHPKQAEPKSKLWSDETSEDIFELLMKVEPPKDRAAWMRWLSAAKASGLSAEQAEIWSAQDDEKFVAGEVISIWDGIDGTSRGTFFHLLGEAGYGPPAEKEGPRQYKWGARKEARDNLESDGWIFHGRYPVASSLINARNALVAIGCHERLMLDEWTGKVLLDGAEFDDKFQVPNLRIEIERAFTIINYSPSRGAVLEAVFSLATERTVNSIITKLTANDWDGVPRLDAYGHHVYGMDIDDELGNKTAALIPRGAVVRALAPGSHFPYMPIIVSPQGYGKTDSLKLISPGGYIRGLSTEGFDPQKQLQERTKGASIVEIGEFEKMNRKELASLKAIITDNHTTNRTAYAREATTHWFTHIMVATTNEDKFLSDDEHRRNPVIKIETSTTEEVKDRLSWLVANRKQLWAEAVHEFHNDIWWDVEEQAHAVRLPRTLWMDSNTQSTFFEIEDPLEVVIETEFERELEEGEGIVSRVLWDTIRDRLRREPAPQSVQKAMQKHGYRSSRVKGKRVWMKDEE